MEEPPLDSTAAAPLAPTASPKCPNCGGLLRYEPEPGGLKCEHCGQLAPMPPPVAPGARELSLDDFLRHAPRGFGSVETSVRCTYCGAEVHLAADERATACTYCASPAVVVQPARADLVQPESLVPFKVSQPRATEAFQKWLKGLWFRPRDLHRMAKLEGVRGVYLPFWSFDAVARSTWRAERGEHYYTTERVTEEDDQGRTVHTTREVQHTRWEPARGEREDGYDDHLVCASKGVPEELASELCEFDTAALVPYSPAYLFGWRAEAYAVDLPEAWKRAKRELAAKQEEACAEDVGGDEQRNLEVETRFDEETFKHLLLPLFVLAYRYRGRPYQVLVNGQTAEVVGRAPYSLWKLLLVAAIVFAVSVLIPPLLLFSIPALLFGAWWAYKHRADLA